MSRLESLQHAMFTIVCECSESDWQRSVALTADEYHKAHSDKNRFIVAPGDDKPEVERVVAKESRFCVEKHDDLKS